MATSKKSGKHTVTEKASDGYEEMTVVHNASRKISLNEKLENQNLRLVKYKAENAKENEHLETTLALPEQQLQLLSKITGEWNLCGNDLLAEKQSECKINGGKNFQWVPGGFFISSNWQLLFGATVYAGIGILGYNTLKKQFYLTEYDNAGYVRNYKLKISGETWTFTGNRTRITLEFGKDGHTFKETREISLDNSSWRLYCEIIGEKRFTEE